MDILLSINPDIKCYDNFYYGFSIPQISKEFDLLKIGKNIVLDLELKDKSVPEEKILKQLIQNKYYLSHLGRRVFLYTYVDETKSLYRLDNNDKLSISNFNTLLVMNNIEEDFVDNINNLFQPSQFLVSPFNNPEKFIYGNYFLTNLQEQIVNDFLSKRKVGFYSIIGNPGTGKTLLVYHIAKKLSSKINVCIIHCGNLNHGHEVLKSKIKNLSIIKAKEIPSKLDFLKVQDLLIIDEAQRIWFNQFEEIKKIVLENNIVCIFSHDPNQILTKSEVKINVSDHILNLPGIIEYKLTDRIRTNREVASFILNMFDLSKKNNNFKYNNIEIVYANDDDEAKVLVSYFKNKNYKFINYTTSSYKPDYFDKFKSSGDYNTHAVLGQDMDNVLVILNKYFYYDTNNKLVAKANPSYGEYLYKQMFYQAITRVVEKLCIIIIDNIQLFNQIVSIIQK